MNARAHAPFSFALSYLVANNITSTNFEIQLHHQPTNHLAVKPRKTTPFRIQMTSEEIEETPSGIEDSGMAGPGAPTPLSALEVLCFSSTYRCQC